MNILKAIATLGQGAADSALQHRLKNDPKLKRKNAAKARKLGEACTPCAAGAYIDNLRKTFTPQEQ